VRYPRANCVHRLLPAIQITLVSLYPTACRIPCRLNSITCFFVAPLRAARFCVRSDCRERPFLRITRFSLGHGRYALTYSPFAHPVMPVSAPPQPLHRLNRGVSHISQLSSHIYLPVSLSCAILRVGDILFRTMPAPRAAHFAVVLSYRGTDFSGWQRQAHRPSVQKCLEEAASAVFKQQVKVRGCGRTDAGVHAIAYVADFTARTRMTASQVVRALNTRLPASVRVTRAREVPEHFHSRFSARGKTYRYLISHCQTPFLADLALCMAPPLDLSAMRKAARYLRGTHDFSAFCASGSAVKNRVRTVVRISFRKEQFCLDPSVPLLAIEIEADGFLYKMARAIVGTLLAAGKGSILPSAVKEILESRDRTKAQPTAPAHALYLKEVKY